MSARSLVPFAALAASLMAAACEQADRGATEAADDLELGAPMAEVISAWRAADLEVVELRDVDDDELPGACVAASVAEIPVVLCELDSAEAAESAEDDGLELVGAATGLALARGARLLIAADRHEVDPDGRRLNEIANAFRQLDGN